ncbi:hypothetical protein ACFVIM_13230 [Streptomyces sp. NPDC057638]|uniref:hypothetical protein n=1 Tax=Streptomyces sp. NPDC057638 TaxID=3346190 RepID=UPI00369B158A
MRDTRFPGNRSWLSWLVTLLAVVTLGTLASVASPASRAAANPPMPTTLDSLQFQLVVDRATMEVSGTLVEREAELSGVQDAAVTADFLRSGHPAGSCEMTTDLSGVFRCSQPGLTPSDWPDQVRVSYAGDALHAPSTAIGQVVYLRTPATRPATPASP